MVPELLGTGRAERSWRNLSSPLVLVFNELCKSLQVQESPPSRTLLALPVGNDTKFKLKKNNFLLQKLCSVIHKTETVLEKRGAHSILDSPKGKGELIPCHG